MVKGPLRKRHLRELKSDPGKYIVIFLILLLSIGEISGYLVADESMLTAYNESFVKYNIEDGNFTAEKKLNQRQKQAVRDAGAEVYDLFFTDRPMDNDSSVRIFAMREQVDLACLMDGALPSSSGEIAIDRMYADNNGLSVGDQIAIQGEEPFTISGLVALSDYSALFENNSDTMFDASKFGVALVTKERFKDFDPDILTWRYAWKYYDPPENETEENDMAEDFVQELSGICSLKSFVPRYQNQAIVFTGEDMGSDRSMMMIFLYAIIVILAFVFSITISSTITKEAGVIGTLRATGYTRTELLRHYMALPVIVTVAACIAGNILGYTFLKNFNADLYYNSYSLPTYVTLWNGKAFLETTVLPLVLMVIINWFVLSRKLRLSPLKFLRRDLSGSKDKKAIKLSKRIPFFTRFRLRIIFQNMGGYLVLLIGILFANFLLLFGMMLPAVLDNYIEALPDNMFCNYQYVLQLPAGAINEDKKAESLINMVMFRQGVETDNEDAEKFSAYVLHTLPEKGIRDEEITLYGVRQGSRYLNIPFRGKEVWVSSAYAEKWSLSPGDHIRLKESYGNEEYEFTVGGIYQYDGALAVFMEQEVLNDTFDLGEGTFNGYFSDTEITDIDEKYIGQIIDFEALSKVSRQLQISMGGMMKLVDAFSIIIFMILVYLLSKVIIEKNGNAISIAKILGYTDSELSRLYILVTSILVVLFLVLSIPLEVTFLTWIVQIMLRSELTGWIPIILSRSVYVKMIIYGIVTYAAVALLEYRKISGVPMDEALKNVE